MSAEDYAGQFVRAGVRRSYVIIGFVTMALENGAQVEDLQKAAGHPDPSMTKLFDRSGYNSEKAASFFAMY